MHAMIDYEFKTGQVFIKMESLEPLHDQIKISMSLFRPYFMSGSSNPKEGPFLEQLGIFGQEGPYSTNSSHIWISSGGRCHRDCGFR